MVQQGVSLRRSLISASCNFGVSALVLTQSLFSNDKFPPKYVPSKNTVTVFLTWQD